MIGLSILSGLHLNYSSRLIEALKKHGVTDKLVIVGGCIPSHDIPAMKDIGIDEVFPEGSKLDEIVDYVRNNARISKE